MTLSVVSLPSIGAAKRLLDHIVSTVELGHPRLIAESVLILATGFWSTK